MEAIKRCRHANVAKTFSVQFPEGNHWSDARGEHELGIAREWMGGAKIRIICF